MVRTEVREDNSHIFSLVLVLTVVAALYFGKEVLIPVALAILLTFVLAPLVNRLERWGLGRIGSIAATMALVFATLGGFGYVVADQAVDFADNLPEYQQNLSHRVRNYKLMRTGPIGKFREAFAQLNKELAAPQPATGAPSAESSTDQADKAVAPVPVQVVESSSSLKLVGDLLGGTVGTLTTFGVAVLFTIFMLAGREDLRNRLIRLIGADQITKTTQAFDDAAGRVSRYLRMQLFINAGFGCMLALGLYVIGLPNALLWGFLAGVLRYIPYLGAWVGAALATAFSLAVFDTWTEPLLVIGLFAVAEFVTGNLLEPVLFHSSTGISSLGVLVAAVFWTWLWGGVGLVLSMPLTVCIIVLGRYVPQFEFFNVLLSDEPVLPPGASYYQRLLVGDEDEANALVDVYLKDHSVDELMDDFLLPALLLAENAAERGILDEAKRQYILESSRDLVEDLLERDLPTPQAGAQQTPTVAIVPARDMADEVVGMMLQRRLESHGVHARTLPAQMLLGEIVDELNESKVPLVFISAVPPYAVRHARHLSKRLHAGLSNAKLLVGVWGRAADDEMVGERLKSAGAEKVASTLGQALEQIERLRPGVLKQPVAEAPAA